MRRFLRLPGLVAKHLLLLLSIEKRSHRIDNQKRKTPRHAKEKNSWWELSAVTYIVSAFVIASIGYTIVRIFMK